MPDLFPGPVLASLRADPDRPAFGPRTVWRGDLLAMVRRLTAALRDAGLGPSRGIGLVLSLSAEAYATHLAAHVLGCRVAAARPGWSPGQLGHALDRQVDAVIADTPLDRPALPLDELLDRPDPGGLLPEGYRVSATLMPPARLHQVLRSRADLSSLPAVVLGGSPALIDTLNAATETGWSVFDLTHYLQPRIAHTGQRSKD